jgi:hypothetical protein
MSTECPRDSHPLTYYRNTREFSCSNKGCECAQCHRPATEAEQNSWRSE